MEMGDEKILLKIKRNFTTNEAVQTLLKIVSGLETEIGVLKTEVAEAQYKIEKIRKERTLTKRQWMQEEIFEDISKELYSSQYKIKEYKRSMENWRAKYLNLLASKNN